MELTDLVKLVAAGETEAVEFKKSTGQLSRAGETICGFLNCAISGTLVFGVSPNLHIVGQQVSDETRLMIAATLKRIEPQAEIQVSEVVISEDHKVIVLQTPSEPLEAIYTFDGRAYQRSGPTTSRMPTERMSLQVFDHPQSIRRWELQSASDFSIDDLDEEEILRAVRTGNEAGRVPEETSRQTIAEIVENFELGKSDTLRNAAIVLFGKKTWPDFPQCELQLARFDGNDKTTFLDQKLVKGHAFHLIGEAMLYCQAHLPVAGHVPPDALRRKDTLLYPFEALREAIVNAFVHRDYSRHGSSVSLAIFDGRLEIWSPGGFPQGVSVSEFKKAHSSVRRNPIIAEVFFRAGFIERWGRGTVRIFDLCSKAGLPEPSFEEKDSSVVVTFFSPVKKATEWTARPPLQQKILEILNLSSKQLSSSQISIFLDNSGYIASRSVIGEALKTLVEEKFVVRTGSARATRYHIQNNEQ